MLDEELDGRTQQDTLTRLALPMLALQAQQAVILLHLPFGYFRSPSTDCSTKSTTTGPTCCSAPAGECSRRIRSAPPPASKLPSILCATTCLPAAPSMDALLLPPPALLLVLLPPPAAECPGDL